MVLQKNINVDDEEEVLVRISENPDISTCRLSAAIGISQSSIWSILKKENLRTYHYSPVQNLLPLDLPVRQQFAQFMLDKPKTRIFFLFKVNIWCGVISGLFIGPFELPPNLNGPLYLNFLEQQLNPLLEEVPLALRRNMWFVQDGAPPHFSLPVRQYLNEHFPHRWIGRGSEFVWPPRSPDCNPLDFSIWSQMKDMVYKDTINSIEELRQKIQEAANIIKNNRQMLFNIQRSLRRRLTKCIEVEGGHFEHLL